MNQIEEQWRVAIQNLREDIKEVRAETREDIQLLRQDTQNWREEVRQEFSDVKGRLTTIETQTATKEGVKQTNWDRVLSITAIVIAAVTALIHYAK
jgi:hypothetical protein